MDGWRRQRGGIHHQEAQGTRSQSRKPPLDSWQPSVPSWERRFCMLVGSVPWRKLLETKKCMYLYDKVVQWNDSAVEEAFHNAKNRYWRKINSLPCDISLPDPDMYIDKIDWESSTDPELLLDLEREPEDPGEGDTDEKVLILDDSLHLNPSFSCTGWGETEEELQKNKDLSLRPGYGNCDRNVDNPWDQNNGQGDGVKDNGWGDDQNDSWGSNQWRSCYNEWENNNKPSENVHDRETGGYCKMWDEISRKKEGSDWYMPRNKTSGYHGSDYQTGRGYWRNGRGRKRVNFAHEQPFLDKKTCFKAVEVKPLRVSHRHEYGRENPWRW